MENKIPKVGPYPNPETYKDRIITAIFNSGILHKKMEGVCFRKHIGKGTDFYQDAIQETFLELCNIPTQMIIDIWEQDPNKLIGFALTIGIRATVTQNANYPDYPKHSLMTEIFHASNLMQLPYLSPTGEKDYEGDNRTLALPYEEEDNDLSLEMWEYIKQRLSPEEIKICNDIMYGSSRRGRKSKKFKDSKEKTINKIKSIVKNENYE